MGAQMRQRCFGSFWKPQSLGLLSLVIFLSLAAHARAANSITFVGASALSDYGGPVTSVSIEVPAGVQAGDLLIAQLANYDGTGSNVPTPPAGWSIVRHDAASNGNRITSWLYYKIAGSGEPPSYTWSIGSQWAAGAMGAWRGVMPTPIDLATGTSAIGNSRVSASPPASNPTYGNELRLCFYASQNSSAPALSLPGGLTQRFSVGSSKEGFTVGFGDADAAASGSYSATVTGTGVLTAQSILIIAAGSGPTATTPIPTSTPTPPPSTPVGTPTPAPTPVAQPTLVFGGSMAGIAFVAASRLSDFGGPVSSVVISLPDGVEAGDCLLAQIIIFDPNASNVPTPPSGWSLIRHDSISGGYRLTAWLYYKIAGSSEPATYSWNIASQWAAGAMGAWRGTSSPPIDSSSGATGSGKGVAAPSLTPSFAGELQIYFYSAQADLGPSITVPSTMTERSNTSSSLEGFSLAFGELAAPSAGAASPTYKATATGGGAMSAQAILLIPANQLRRNSDADSDRNSRRYSDPGSGGEAGRAPNCIDGFRNRANHFSSERFGELDQSVR